MNDAILWGEIVTLVKPPCLPELGSGEWFAFRAAGRAIADRIDAEILAALDKNH